MSAAALTPEKPASAIDRTVGGKGRIDAEQSEVKMIEGSSQAVPYHSLVASAGQGCKWKRHREFVVYNRDAAMPEYLLAYRRVFPTEDQITLSQFDEKTQSLF